MTRDLKEAIVFVMPLVLFVASFTLIPVLGTLWNSLWLDVSFVARRFFGLQNYFRLISDEQFWQAALFTTTFALVSVLIEMIIGTIIALVLNERFRMRGILRGIALIPWAMPSVIGARVWQLIYRYDYGIANWVLQNIGLASVNWFGSPLGSFVALVLADVWRTTPFVAIIILAGLQTVRQDLLEQAQVDGANMFQRFFKITTPIIKPIIIVALLFRTIDALRIFDLVYVLTGGGPGGATTSLSLYGYKFFLIGDFGYGSTVSVILFILTFTLAILYIRVGRLRTS